MTSRSMIDRLGKSLRNPPTRQDSEYTLQELEPRPEDSLLLDMEQHTTPPNTRPALAMRQRRKSHSSDQWLDRDESVASSSKKTVMFAGPPPPIARSVVASGDSNRRIDGISSSSRFSNGQPSSSKSGVRSLLFHHAQPTTTTTDTVPYKDMPWRVLRGREKAVEREIQQLLDLQANGLVSGIDGRPSSAAEVETASDTGSSTPTGTFYSTATSKSQMANSLHIPARSNADGNVIPVRQPRSNKPRGLRSIRVQIRNSMSALAQIKLEEDSHVEEALYQRREMLNTIDKLDRRRHSVSNELNTLEEDEQEPLGRQLRELGEEYDSLGMQIRELEAKLVGMRNQRRWIKNKMEDVKNNREAGLSGYRGALHQVDSEVSSLMARPPVQPLDLQVLPDMAHASSTGGAEFMSMIPERRTLEMAKTWLATEVSILQRHKAKIDRHRQALDQGAVVWDEVMQLVSNFESRLQQIMKGGGGGGGAGLVGKGKVESQEDIIRSQLPEMEMVAQELARHVAHAEENQWNLLICAIGAELEAFSEACDMLRSALSRDASGGLLSPSSSPSSPTAFPRVSDPEVGGHVSDGEAPNDLLVSMEEEASEQAGLRQEESLDEVPDEFLAQHRQKQD